jgi:predicted  nucleic acid-binding Zn-ribbon protein
MAKHLTIADLTKELETAKTERARWEKSWGEERQKRSDAENSLAESRTHFADLKERLSNAEAETARLRGYLARVHEDDVVRDGMVEIEDERGKRQVPKRPPPLESVGTYSMVESIGSTSYDSYGRPKKRTHWTSY